MGYLPALFDPGISLVAFYGNRPAQLTRLIESLQSHLRGSCPAGRFIPRPTAQVHATITRIYPMRYASGNSADRGSLNTTVAIVRDAVKSKDTLPLIVQFGGFAENGHYGFESKGKSPFERSFEINDGHAILIGWSPSRKDPCDDPLGGLRSELGKLGFSHKYSDSGHQQDADMYITIGDFDPVYDVSLGKYEIVREVRERLAANKTVVTMKPEDLSIVTYFDRSLPLGSTRATSLV